MSSSRKLSSLKEWLSKAKSLGILLGLYFCSQLSIAFLVSKAMPKIDFWNLQLSLKAQSYEGILNKMTESQLMAFLEHYYVDYLIHPIIYGTALCSYCLVNQKLYQNKYSNLFKLLFWAPIIAASLDVFENSVHFANIVWGQKQFNSFIYAANIAARCKWSLALGAFFVNIVLSVLYFFKYRKKKI